MAETEHRLKDSLRDPANLAAALGYYRATIGGAGHFLHLERPDVVNAQILDFLRD